MRTDGTGVDIKSKEDHPLNDEIVMIVMSEEPT